jgi:hypothetical protein
LNRIDTFYQFGHSNNSILGGNLKLSDETLVEKYNIYGGVPRSIFTRMDTENTDDLNAAIKSFDALKLISYVKENGAVREEKYSHRVLCMVPREENYRSNFYLDFLSKHIAELVIEKVEGDSLRALCKFSIAHANDDSGSTAVVRGRIFEMLCHKWFKQIDEFNICCRSLTDVLNRIQINPKQMVILRFSKLEDIKDIACGCWTYCRPNSGTFGALDAFILDTINMKCYGLQMTINLDHGIKAQPMKYFLIWLNELKIQNEKVNWKFFFVFVVPSSKEPQFPKQSIRTKTDNTHTKPGDLADIDQYVAAVDVFYDKFIN